MNEMHANPMTLFAGSVQELFTTMLGCDARVKTVVQASAVVEDCRMISIVGLNGPVRGAVALIMTAETALAMVSRFIGMDAREVDATVIDAVSELANIIAGCAKTNLNIHSNEPVTLSIPTVIMGQKNELLSPSWSAWRQVDFDSELGPFSLRVTLEQGGWTK